MRLRDALQLIGTGLTAGITGAYLALRIRRPRQSYSEFLQLYTALSVDFVRRLENVFVETMVPQVAPEDREELEALFDRSATFPEKLRFFQQRLPGFDELTLKAFARFEQSDEGGFMTSALRRKAAQVQGRPVDVAMSRLHADLRESLLLSMRANVPSDRITELDTFLAEHRASGLLEMLHFYREAFPGFGSVLFDAISRFENRIFDLSQL